MQFFIADLHFGDSSIIKTENRPFKDVTEMNDTLIRNWNKVVRPSDDVFVLGDVVGIDTVNPDKVESIMCALNGNISVVLGNHDNSKEILRALKNSVDNIIPYPILLDNFWILSHEPVYIMNSGPYANIFGHVHGNPIYKTVSHRSYCVSVERINYTPISFEYIKNKVKEQELVSSFLNEDISI